jgi:hypothetical protein
MVLGASPLNPLSFRRRGLGLKKKRKSEDVHK